MGVQQMSNSTSSSAHEVLRISHGITYQKVKSQLGQERAHLPSEKRSEGNHLNHIAEGDMDLDPAELPKTGDGFSEAKVPSRQKTL